MSQKQISVSIHDIRECRVCVELNKNIALMETIEQVPIQESASLDDAENLLNGYPEVTMLVEDEKTGERNEDPVEATVPNQPSQKN